MLWLGVCTFYGKLIKQQSYKHGLMNLMLDLAICVYFFYVPGLTLSLLQN